MLDLTFLDQVLDRARYVFDRHAGVNPVLIEQIDDIGVETLERGVGDLLDMLRPAVQASAALAVWFDIEAELGGNHHSFTERSECFAHEFFVDKRAVDLGGIEECDAEFDCRIKEIISCLSLAGP